VATDHVIESFRNGLWPGYKTGEGIEADLLAQFPLLEDTLSAAGVVVWPMVEFEADDALAAGAVAAARDARVERVIICTPDKDLAQCVIGTRIVQLNRRTRVLYDEAGVRSVLTGTATAPAAIEPQKSIDNHRVSGAMKAIRSSRRTPASRRTEAKRRTASSSRPYDIRPS